MFKRILRAATVLLTVLAACAPLMAQEGCPVEGWWDDAGTHVVDYFDTQSVAEVTPRIQLSPMLLEMYRIYRAFQRVDHPDCVFDAAEAVDAFMMASILAFKDYMLNQDTTGEIDPELFDEATEKFIDLLDEFEELGYTFDINAGELCAIATGCP